MIERVSSIAGGRFPHGSPVRIERGRSFLETDLAVIDGVTARPQQTFATHHEEGEQLLVQTDGGILADVGGLPRWLELRRGRILND